MVASRRGGEREIWLDRYAAFAPMIAPEDDEAALREAGFTDVAMVWAAFTWRDWTAYA